MALAIRRVCAELELPTGDAFTQDWAYELPEQFRTLEYLQRYIRALSGATLAAVERVVLMTLVLDVVNDLMASEPAGIVGEWRQVRDLLPSDPALYRDLLAYWALEGEE